MHFADPDRALRELGICKFIECTKRHITPGDRLIGPDPGSGETKIAKTVVIGRYEIKLFIPIELSLIANVSPTLIGVIGTDTAPFPVAGDGGISPVVCDTGIGGCSKAVN